MADQEPMIRVIEFDQTFETMAKLDEFGDRILDDKGNLVMALQAEIWVTYAPAHNPVNTQTRERVRHLMPNKDMKGDKSGEKRKFVNVRWLQIEPHYNAYLAGEEIPTEGTALGQWAGANKAQSEALKAVGLRTVEEVAAMTDTMCDRVRMPNVRDFRKSAIAYLENAGAAATAAKSAETDSKIEKLEEQLGAAMELLEERSAPKAPAPEVDEEVISLRAQLDEKGIAYHYLNKAPKLTELLIGAE